MWLLKRQAIFNYHQRCSHKKMIYLFIIFFILIGVLRYDFSSKKPHHKKIFYRYILVFFILMSGLSYKVGSDINAYMAEFSIISYDDMIDADFFVLANKQPLWLLFENICKTVVNDFAFMKIVISIFVCVVFFRFFQDNTKYYFSSILAYFFMISFDVNFNILRQSIAMAFFLIAYSCMKNNKFLLTYLFVTLAVMFHNSAVVLLIVPLLTKINIHKVPFLSWTIAVATSIGLLFFMSYSGLFQGLAMVIQSDDFNTLAELYDGGEYGTSSVRIVSVMFYVFLHSFIYYYLVKFKYPNLLIWMFVFYTVIFLLSYSIPILGRIKLYFTPFYIVAVIELIYIYTKENKSVKNMKVMTVVLLMLFIFPSVKYFFTKNPRYNDMQLIQYYPYHSIIDKGVEQKRERLFPANY